jgi:hypothetical protein
MLPDSTPEQRFANKILEMTPEQFDEWAEKATLEEVAYATNMVMIANQQLREQMECIQEEDEYYIEQELNDMSYDTCGFEDARDALSKFTLKGIK